VGIAPREIEPMESDDRSRAPGGSPAPPPPADGGGKAAGSTGAGGELDLEIDEIEPTSTIKEGFTGQER